MYPYFFHTRRDVRGHEEQGSLEEHVPSRSIQVYISTKRCNMMCHASDLVTQWRARCAPPSVLPEEQARLQQ